MVPAGGRGAYPRRCRARCRLVHPTVLAAWNDLCDHTVLPMSECFEETKGMQDLAQIYRGYIDCLNRQDWSRLEDFVAADAVHNGRKFGLDGYRNMLEADFRAIPDLRFNIDLLVVEAPKVASRLIFDCRPVGQLFGLPVNGRNVRFSENVFYRFSNGRIEEVWSIIDTAAIKAQLA
jgi:predicted ester cyclase